MQMLHCKKILRQAISGVSFWLAGLALVACGGGDLFSLAPGLGSGGTGSVAGTLTGLGSVIVDGVRYDDSAAALERQSDLVQTQTLSLSDLQVGQYVYLELDASGTPTRVRLDSQLVGLVGSVNTSKAQLTVWGQTVGINTDASQGPVTVFSGYAGLAEVSPTDPVQVYGVLQTDPANSARELIRATRIERLVSTDALPARVTGALNAKGTGLTLAGVPLDTTKITNLAAKVLLQAGQVVTVVLPWPQDLIGLPNSLQATSVRVVGTADSSASTLRLSGVAQLRTDGLVWVQGVVVNLSDPSLATLRGTVTSGTYVTVTGQLNPSIGQLVATAVEMTPAGGRPEELRGSITSLIDQRSFMVRGLRVNAGNAVWVGGTAEGLVNGRYVELTGSVTGNVFNASKVVLQDGLPEKAVLDITGVVQSADQSNRKAKLLTSDGQTLTVVFSVNDSLPSVGDTVRVEGLWKDGTLQSRTLSRQSPKDDTATQLEGIVDAVGDGQFTLNGVQVAVDASLFGGLQISRGERVEVLVNRSGNSYTLVGFKAKPPRR
ncbi:MAG: DUF5666 domain-containing protein [Rhodoferax sp.]|nr:DUF5666 domain-containing protein [Rhodoferax sp.]